MAILEVVLEQTFAGQQVINRFNYIQTGTPAAVSPSFGLVAALGAIPDAGVYPPLGLMAGIAFVQVSDVNFVSISAKNLYSVTDFYQTPFTVPLAGGAGAEGLPPTNATGFRTNRTRLDIRRGFKRLAGVPEAVQTNGVFTPAHLLVLDDVAGIMSDVLEYDDEGNTLVYTPCILKRDKQAHPTIPGSFVYPYFPTESAQLDNAMTSIIWEPYSTVRTQTSRQFGQGS